MTLLTKLQAAEAGDRSMRRITIEEHIAAKSRLDPANAKWVTLKFPDGTESRMITGTVDINDYTRRDGHVVRFSFDGEPLPDRFGWPVGDPRSPASLAAKDTGEGG